MGSTAIDRIAANPLLDQEAMLRLDGVIREIPDEQLRSADHGVAGLDPAVSIDPFGHFGKLRDAGQDVIQYIDGKYGPLAVYNGFGRDLALPNFAVVGYSALKSMVLDPASFVNEGAYGAHGDAQNPGFTFVNELDGADHKAMRRLFEQEVFSRRFLTDLADDTIAPLAEFLTQRIRGMVDDGEEADLCRDLALPLLYMSMAKVIGIDMVDLAYFVGLGEAVFGGPRDFEAAGRAAEELDRYFGQVYEERKAKGDLDKGDLMSLMSQAEREGLRFSAREIIVYCRFLLPAGIETTWRQAANIGYSLMLHPDQYRQIVADPSLTTAAIEEATRWMPSGFVLPRTAAKDTELAGVHIPAGSSMYGIFGVANRDPRIWPDADRFDIHRKRTPHLTFSAGSHTCMGQQLARQSFAHVMRSLTTNLPDIELAVDPSEVRTTGFIIRCPDAVPVRKA
ncbi:Cytochrome P450 [Sphingopyxis sp. YR583]|uniref:cytochrome P450 n=1 Tax=Sphingopyxis sp. YR583 TaxID=1881047 RepID=UPI0008A7CA42|nr:cytochrome P450 [Sphingopyxis sp. YR583]SEH19229.1 Cytochrome P450 [Sphingopyxis sp. YR583]